MGQLMSSNAVRCIFTMKFEYRDINVEQEHRAFSYYSKWKRSKFIVGEVIRIIMTKLSEIFFLIKISRK